MKTAFPFFQTIERLCQQANLSHRKIGKSLPVHIGYGIFFLHLLFFALRFVFAMLRLDYSLLPLHPLYLLFWCAAPVLLYLWGTKISFYNFRDTKYRCLAAVLFSEYLVLLSLAFFLLSRLFLPGILSLPVDEAFTKGMVILLGRLITQLLLLPTGFLLAKIVFFPLRDETTRKRILEYKITHSIAPERNSPSNITYNMNIVKDIHSGKNITVYAKDRFLHTLVDGTSGTGR